MNLIDHAGVRLAHGKPRVNGVEIHYAIGGAGGPGVLLHGAPKTMSYWRHVVPLLTPHYTVIAVDNRGAGGSQRPLTGYDTATMAGDVAELATHLGFDQFRVAGEDWGAAIAYAVAAFHRPRVQQLVFQETLLPGLPAGERDPRSPPTTSAPAGTSASSACRTCPSCCWPGGTGRSGRTTPDARCGTPARWPRRTSTKSCTRPSSWAGPGRSWRCTAPARPTPNRTARITPTRSAARSWPSARRPVSGTQYPSSSRRWLATSAAPSSPRPVITSRWRTRRPWPRPTSTSSQAAKPRGHALSVASGARGPASCRRQRRPDLGGRGGGGRRGPGRLLRSGARGGRVR